MSIGSDDVVIDGVISEFLVNPSISRLIFERNEHIHIVAK